MLPDSEELKKDLLAKTATVKKGDRIDDVVKTIGHSFTTEPYDLGDELDEIYGTKLIYKIEDPRGVQHEYITFWFGNDDRLVKTTTNMKDVPYSPRTRIHTEGIDLENLTRSDN
jgi:hypothetical protein